MRKETLIEELKVKWGCCRDAAEELFDAGSASRDAEVESLRQQLADSQKREVMLRDALTRISSGMCNVIECEDIAREALAATADLDGLIMCHAEPMCFIGQGLEPLVKKDLEKLNLREPGFSTLYDTPLYRAWEQK